MADSFGGPNEVKARMGYLKELLKKRQELDKAFFDARKVMEDLEVQRDKVSCAFANAKEDFVHDLFNGRMGEEFVL